MKKWQLWMFATIGVIIIFQICYGFAILQPSNINWLMSARHDWGTHYLGWAFYKNEPWHFPLGKVLGYNYPVGTNVGFTDSIPLLAIFFKLFAPFLSSDFQYFGLWLFLCHLLVAYFTILLFRLFKINSLITLTAAIFITANPVLIHRGIHPALCAHWLLIAGIYFYFLNPQHTNPNKIILYQFLILALSALINPYLCLMVMGFSFATPLKLSFFDKVFNWKKCLIYISVSLFSVALIWYVTGMISFGSKEDFGVGGAYGLYSMNLNSLYNARGFAALTRSFEWVSWHQYEGFMYLGAGILLLIIILFSYYGLAFIKGHFNKSRVWEKTISPNKRFIPLIVLVFLYAIFSTTFFFSYNSKIILRIPAPAFFVHLEEVFRACGRFFWMPYYLIILFTIIGMAKIKMNHLIAPSLIIAALIVQLYDIKLLLTFRNLPYGTYTPPMDNHNWIQLMSQFDEILFFPAFESPKIRPMDYQDFCYLALKAGRPVNLAYVARGDLRSTKNFIDSLTRIVEMGDLSPKALYITNAYNLEHFSVAFQSNTAQINLLDSCYYIYSRELKNEKLKELANKLNAPVRNRLDSTLNMMKTRTEFLETAKISDSGSKFIRYWLESVNIGKSVISMQGWAFIDTTQNNKGDSIFVILTGDEKSYLVKTRIVQRPDVSVAFGKKSLDESGFGFIAFTDQVPPGKYKIGLAIKDAQGQTVYQSKLLSGEMPLIDYFK